MQYFGIIFMLFLVACSASPTHEISEPMQESPKPLVSDSPEHIDTEPVSVRIKSKPDDASGEMHILVGESGEPVKLPDDVREGIENATTPQVLGDGASVIYDDESRLMLHDVRSGRSEVLSEIPQLDTLDYGWVSPSGHRIAAISADSTTREATLTVFTKDTPESDYHKKTYPLDPPPLIRCNSRCTVASAKFCDEDNFCYLVSGGANDPEHTRDEPMWNAVPVN